MPWGRCPQPEPKPLIPKVKEKPAATPPTKTAVGLLNHLALEQRDKMSWGGWPSSHPDKEASLRMAALGQCLQPKRCRRFMIKGSANALPIKLPCYLVSSFHTNNISLMFSAGLICVIRH